MLVVDNARMVPATVGETTETVVAGERVESAPGERDPDGRSSRNRIGSTVEPLSAGGLMGTGVDDQELTRCVFAAKQGDADAAAAFVRGTQRQVWQLLRHLTDGNSAEDLTQECYLRAFGSLGSYRGRAPARTWLLSIARRVAADHLRHRARRPRRAEQADWQRAAEASQPRTPGLLDGYALRSALDALDQRRREAFVLTQVLGLGYAETARVLGCRTGTVRSRVARARSELMEQLRERDPGRLAEPGD
ncbi:sigma-70 family RNA polymerase sigma factor [Actinopolyspora mortivallis]|uniref:RNA polymerase subunit sigma n=1 Tax=Actinopolyspora mortivallis TaxID=33906 RepID=A0A2T0GX78_ACTMO|nr:sigma-70 family RNA polymerase sigma factor [Actinopolyspora mortivallis]PRW63725.1 hypothetical protein CEP50_08920 [Actinopolyspora mortivallis]